MIHYYQSLLSRCRLCNEHSISGLREVQNFHFSSRFIHVVLFNFPFIAISSNNRWNFLCFFLFFFTCISCPPIASIFPTPPHPILSIFLCHSLHEVQQVMWQRLSDSGTLSLALLLPTDSIYSQSMRLSVRSARGPSCFCRSVTIWEKDWKWWKRIISSAWNKWDKSILFDNRELYVKPFISIDICTRIRNLMKKEVLVYHFLDFVCGEL